MSTDLERRWRFRSREGGRAIVTPLWLDAEPLCLPCIDDLGDESGVAQLAYYLDYLQRECPEAWEQDRIEVYWSVLGEGISEQAPVANDDENFLSFFSQPYDARTGELINWWRLPVRSRFPKFAAALGWAPSPFQPFAPLRSILTGDRRAGRLKVPGPLKNCEHPWASLLHQLPTSDRPN